MSASDAEPTWALDREIVLSRVFDAPRALVFRVWTEREHVARWFGPRGFTTTVHEMDARVGGRWRFEMRAPDGTVFPNRIDYLEIVPPERLVFDHGSDRDDGDDPQQFRVTITFDEQRDGKTVHTTVTFAEHQGKTTLAVHQVYARATDATRGANAGWTLTLDQLAAYVRERS